MILDDFSSYLMPGEQVIWYGEPKQGVSFSGRDAFMIPFSLMWGGFAIFWETTVISTRAPWFFKLWGIPFVIVGLYLIIGRFFVDAWIRRCTAYSLTDRRALVIRAAPFTKITSINLGSLSNVGLTESANGRGTIQFGDPPVYAYRQGWSGWMPALDQSAFIGIEDARNVFARIQSLMPRSPAVAAR
jgi:hypothetical protein